VADLVIMDVEDASGAVGVYRRSEFAAIVMVVVSAMMVAAAVGVTAAVMATTAAAVTAMRGCELRSAQTKRDCERKNRNRFSDVHDDHLLLDEHADESDPACEVT
jgi:hypothetical protein